MALPFFFFLKRLDFKLENEPHVISSCVVLHNICETFGTVVLMSGLTPQPCTLLLQVHLLLVEVITAPAHIRNAIVQHLSTL